MRREQPARPLQCKPNERTLANLSRLGPVVAAARQRRPPLAELGHSLANSPSTASGGRGGATNTAFLMTPAKRVEEPGLARTCALSVDFVRLDDGPSVRVSKLARSYLLHE